MQNSTNSSVGSSTTLNILHHPPTTMTKSNKPTRRSCNKPNVPIITQATAKSLAIKAKRSPIKNRTTVKKEKKAAAEAMVSPLIEVVEQQPIDGSVQLYLSINTNSKNQEIVSAPLFVPFRICFFRPTTPPRQISKVIFSRIAPLNRKATRTLRKSSRPALLSWSTHSLRPKTGTTSSVKCVRRVQI